MSPENSPPLSPAPRQPDQAGEEAEPKQIYHKRRLRPVVTLGGAVIERLFGDPKKIVREQRSPTPEELSGEGQ